MFPEGAEDKAYKGFYTLLGAFLFGETIRWPQGVKRKHMAVLSADVAGYSRLMGEVDVAIVWILGEYRDGIVNHIIQYQDWMVDSPEAKKGVIT